MSETCKIESLVASIDGNLLGTSFRLLLNKEGYKGGLSSQSTTKKWMIQCMSYTSLGFSFICSNCVLQFHPNAKQETTDKAELLDLLKFPL